MREVAEYLSLEEELSRSEQISTYPLSPGMHLRGGVARIDHLDPVGAEPAAGVGAAVALTRAHHP